MSNIPRADRAYFAAFLDLRGKPGVVVGGGAVAALKAEALLRSGVRVTVIAEEAGMRIAELALLGRLRLEKKRFRSGDLAGADIVIAATDDAAVNEAVSAEARERRIPVNVVDDPALSTFIMPTVFAGNEAAAARALEEKFSHGERSLGFVSLVGGGPGEPELLTMRALRVLQSANVVLYDKLVSPALVDLARCDAERLYVGKQQDNHALPQGEINALMVRLAREGKRVVRLKGGDPFIFGRGGEEIDALAAQGIPFEVVPGVTAAAGASAYAGIPLTHRDYADACVFVTGHARKGGAPLDFGGLVRPRQTIVVYMGVGALAAIRDGLLSHGLARSTPCALVENATLPEQRVIVSTLQDIVCEATAGNVRAPALLIVGEVVRLHSRLAWFGSEKRGQDPFLMPEALAEKGS